MKDVCKMTLRMATWLPIILPENKVLDSWRHSVTAVNNLFGYFKTWHTWKGNIHTSYEGNHWITFVPTIPPNPLPAINFKVVSGIQARILFRTQRHHVQN